LRGPWLMGARSLRWRPTLTWIAPLLALGLLGQSACPLPGGASGITFTAAAGPAVGATPRALVAGDFNRDRKLDLAVAPPGANAGALRSGNAPGTFPVGPDIAVGTTPFALTAADLDGDGTLDLAVAK